MSTITTHVLDTSSGRPATGVQVTLARLEAGGATAIGSARTDADGRVREFAGGGGALDAGEYRLTFETGAYYEAAGVSSFHPRIAVDFTVEGDAQHYHVPLLLSPYGYSTYRGS